MTDKKLPEKEIFKKFVIIIIPNVSVPCKELKVLQGKLHLLTFVRIIF
jgi:hypothetical protein